MWFSSDSFASEAQFLLLFGSRGCHGFDDAVLSESSCSQVPVPKASGNRQCFASLAVKFESLSVEFTSDHRRRQNVVGTISGTLGNRLVYHVFCSYHILTSSVVYYSTDARQHGIYLLNRNLELI